MEARETSGGNFVRVNDHMGRLFATSKEKMDENPKRPILSGNISVDGVWVYACIWKRASKNKPGTFYYELQMTYPQDETARLQATGPATSAMAKKESKFLEEHVRTDVRDRAKWKHRETRKGPDPAVEDYSPF